MSKFSQAQKKRNAQRAAWGIPQDKWGGDVGDELEFIPDEALTLAYRTQRNPFNMEEEGSGGAGVLAKIRQELARRHGEQFAARLTSKDTGGTSGLTRNIGKTTIGPALQKLAPLAAFIPGVGPIAAGAIAAGAGGVGRGLQGKKILDPKAIARDALLAGGGKYLMQGASLAGEGALKGASGAPLSLTDRVVSGVGKIAAPVVGAITKDPLKAAQIGLAGYSAYQGQRRADQASDLVDRSISRGTGTGVVPEDLSQLFLDPSNPFSGGASPQGTSLTAARRALMGAR